jgi:3-phenylpropionate/trans-cinnamate dioxygenase ferredoxin reductase subunit
MPDSKYLIVGGGMAADAAIHGIREVDSKGSIALIGAESDPPYDRPPLSKGLWKGKPLDTIWRDTSKQAVELYLGREAKTLDPQNKRIVDEHGAVYTFEKLLLATGGTPRELPARAGRILYFRSLQDYRTLRAMAEQGRRFGVIGGGFIGSEIAAALTMNGKEAVMIFPGEGIGDRTFPRDLSKFLNGYYIQQGVQVLPGQSVVDVEAHGEQVVFKVRDEKTSKICDVTVDGVVAGIGIQPNIELAEIAGLETGNGIIVNEFLQTSHADIYAAGDVAAFHNPALSRYIRVEHEDNANTMGRVAGRAMAGKPEPYRHLPFFYSDLFDLGYEAVGELDPRLETVTDWQEPFRKGVIYYLQDARVRGVLLWNVWGQVDAARSLIAEPGPFKPADLKGRLPAKKA